MYYNCSFLEMSYDINLFNGMLYDDKIILIIISTEVDIGRKPVYNSLCYATKCLLQLYKSLSPACLTNV